MADQKRNKAREARKGFPPQKETSFRPGRSGLCEAQLWEFTGPGRFRPEDEEMPIKRVAAASLDEALKFVRRRYPDFIITKGVAIGMITMLSGSPFE
jgi:hypothetical protein